MRHAMIILAAGLLIAADPPGERGTAAEYDLPAQIEVLPVFFVPRGEKPPSPEQARRLSEHLAWCQKRYREMLSGRDTFAISAGVPRVYRSKTSLAELKNLPEDGAPRVVGELLSHFKFNRYNCPFIFLTVVVNPRENKPAGGGRSCNGGFNTGCGIVLLSYYGLVNSPNFQSTLQHELGHGFGLPHVDAYHYDMQSSASVMSYNPAHHTSGMNPSTVPGILIPEDVRGLAMNRRAFAKLTFDRARDVPPGYSLAKVAVIPAMKIDGEPPYAPEVKTTSGADYGSSVSAIVGNPIEPSVDPGLSGKEKVTFNGKTMWHSAPSETGWVVVEIKFPVAVTLTGLGVHSQHSGQYHAADAIRVSAQVESAFQVVAEQPLESVDAVVPLKPATSRSWKLSLHAANKRVVVLRGLQFFSPTGEIFPPPVPYDQ